MNDWCFPCELIKTSEPSLTRQDSLRLLSKNTLSDGPAILSINFCGIYAMGGALPANSGAMAADGGLDTLPASGDAIGGGEE